MLIFFSIDFLTSKFKAPKIFYLDDKIIKDKVLIPLLERIQVIKETSI